MVWWWAIGREGRTDVGHAVAVAEDVLHEHLLDDTALRPGIVVAGIPGVAATVRETCRLLVSFAVAFSNQQFYEFTLRYQDRRVYLAGSVLVLLARTGRLTRHTSPQVLSYPLHRRCPPAGHCKETPTSSSSTMIAQQQAQDSGIAMRLLPTRKGVPSHFIYTL